MDQTEIFENRWWDLVSSYDSRLLSLSEETYEEYSNLEDYLDSLSTGEAIRFICLEW